MAVCYYFVVLHLFSAVRTSHHCQRFCRVINLSTEDKTGELGCFFFKEPSLSFIHGGGRHKLIHEVVKRREQNPIRMGANTMVQEGGSYDGKYRK